MLELKRLGAAFLAGTLCAAAAPAADLTVRELAGRLHRAERAQPLQLRGLDLRELDLSGLDFKAADLMREHRLEHTGVVERRHEGRGNAPLLKGRRVLPD